MTLTLSSEALLGAMSQQVMELDGDAPATLPVRQRAVRRSMPSARPAGAGDAAHPTTHDLEQLQPLAFARALAGAFTGIEALEVGPDVAPRGGVRNGDVVMIDWAGSGGARVVAVQAPGDVVRLQVAPAFAGEGRSGAVFAVVRFDVSHEESGGARR